MILKFIETEYINGSMNNSMNSFKFQSSKMIKDEL